MREMVSAKHQNISASDQARAWCKRRKAWRLICDIPDSSIFSKTYQEMPQHVRDYWDGCGGEEMWIEFGAGEHRVNVGHIGESGYFYPTILEVTRYENTMMVFRTSRNWRPS
jgi:hypothetical protein